MKISLTSLILVSFFVGCSSPVSTVSAYSDNTPKIKSEREYCSTKGGSWIWNGDINKWRCIGVDMSNYYEIKMLYADKNQKSKLNKKKHIKRLFKSTASVNSNNADSMESEKEYCLSQGGSWKWNGIINKWDCKGGDTSDYYIKKQNIELKKLDMTSPVKNCDYYIRNFNITNNINTLQKAEKLAKSKLDKAKVEKAYIDFIGNYSKVFKIDTSSIPGEKTTNVNTDVLFLKDLSKSKKIRYKIKLSKNNQSPIPLKYGSYKISVSFIIKLTYKVDYEIGNVIFSNNKTKSFYKNLIFNLNKHNRYRDYQILDFGEFSAASSGSLSFIGIQSKIINATLSSSISEIKLKKL